MRQTNFPTFRQHQRRRATAMLLTVIYLVMALGPLAPLALRSPHVAHALTGECAGDCDICGCAAEKRANHTCCCAQKNRAEAKQTIARECCKPEPDHGAPVLKCGCPCGSDKQATLLNFDKNELLPFMFHAANFTPVIHAIPPARPRPLVSRCGEPVEPPPRLLPA
ncbi:hypothetical protein KP001_02310 [Geomonas subterranea]|uniref:Secreted protein n=1 Tax=Geomonas subterranea TaxID=2847989 RepID=A0ABX8LIV2_9BACT|nr:hypothetical protein [Geomonas subterranea]QXE91399.1 hypothetical protein KP001_02310 [Geomonas subterranea]QXM10513.1 hypothetical protein KP002_05185 [Geomonas subterranea]